MNLEVIETTTAVYDQCSLRKDEGENCGNHTDRWYYDSTANECKRFMYKGCGGNDNNFETREKCTIKCNHNYLDTSFINCKIKSLILPLNPVLFPREIRFTSIISHFLF